VIGQNLQSVVGSSYYSLLGRPLPRKAEHMYISPTLPNFGGV
jgi:hypothetical protein